jgi:aromatic-L-amino-acid decarboxylase
MNDGSGSRRYELLNRSLEWVLKYLDTVEQYPVLSKNEPGAIASAIPEEAPSKPDPIERIMEDLDSVIVPGLTHWNHPRFFGYFAVTGSEPGIAGELLSAAMNVNGMVWRTSPAVTELEEVAGRWFTRMIGLPDRFCIINDTASTSSFTALASARHRAAPDSRVDGVHSGPRLMTYTSVESHSSIDKAVLALGLGTSSVRKIVTDDRLRMDPIQLERAIQADIEAGAKPMAVVATVGTTSTTSVDPVAAIAEICRRYGAWLHVDAAYAGPAAVLPSHRWILDGCEHADSLVTNPHKWLFVPIDCSLLFLKDPEITKQAFSVIPDYLQTTESASNLMDYGISLGRRFRALKLWMVMRSMGTDGIRDAISRQMAMAKSLASTIANEPDFHVVSPVEFAVVNFRFAPPYLSDEACDQLNRAIADQVNSSGTAFVTTTLVRNRVAIHVSIGNLATTKSDVELLWSAIKQGLSS